jgi:general secretion pathway protein G
LGQLLNKPRGFTLIELMLAVAIIGILSAIAIPQFADLIGQAQEGMTKSNLGVLRSALSIYFADADGGLPVSLNSLVPRYIKAIPSVYTAVHGKQSTVFLGP